MHLRIGSLTFSFLTVLGLVTGAPAQLVPLGGELQVNTYTTGPQYGPAVAGDTAGNFVVVWDSYGSPGTDVTSSIQGQRYDAAGAPLGPQFQVNTYTTNGQVDPALASDGAGNFVVAWTSFGSVGSDTDFCIQGQRYDSAGAPVGGQFQVNTYTTNGQSDPAVAGDGAGNFVVVWASYGSAGTDTDVPSIQGQRYDSAGAPLGGEFQVNTYTTGGQYQPKVAVDGAGAFIVAWLSFGSAGPDTDSSSIQGRRYDSAGAPQGAQFQVNTYTTSFTIEPSVAADAVGNFVIAWNSFGSAGSDTDNSSIQGRRYDSAGMPQGAQFQVNTNTAGGQYDPSATTDGGGNFVVAWWEFLGGGSDTDGIQGQRYDAAGAPSGGQFQVNTYTTNVQRDPAIVADAAGNFVVAWEGFGSAGSDQDGSIHSQRYAVGRTILGKKLVVKDPTGSEINRVVVALGKETSTDVGTTLLGDPTVTGATLRVITNGMVDSNETYILDAAGWSARGSTGFKYKGPTGGDGDPVKSLIVKRTPNGLALVKVLLKGSTGIQSMDVVPPNLGDDGGLILTINGGGTYCVALGGGAGGSEVKDDDKLWKFINAGAQACPAP